MRTLRSRIFRLVVKYWMSPRFNIASTIRNQRKALEGFSKLSILPRKTKIEKLQIGKVRAEWISVGTTLENCVILYLHGGAYCIGSLNTHRELAARISKASKIRTLLIDYRLAPEHPFPAAIEDVVFTYDWLLKNGFLSNNVIIIGDSAGGGLAISTLVKLRDLGAPIPAAAVCISPWTDLELTGNSIQTHTSKDPFLTPQWLQLMAKYYAANNDFQTPLISPNYADLSMLPPLLIQAGSDDILLSDSIRLAEHACESGVDSTLDIWENMWHVWHFFAGKMPEANRAINQISNFIYEHILKNRNPKIMELIN
ncbi:MAG: alpha/beta hydrolase [Ignavibacteriaceae bacterium]|jgi:monoterpene epsilon-lactone hydrolase